MRITKLDTWWEEHSAGRRYDRGPMYFWMMLASFLTSISMILTGPVPNGSISELTFLEQSVLSWVLFLGSGLSVFSAMTGSRFWFPNWSRVKSYGMGLIGVPLVTSAYLFYAYAIVLGTENWQSALGGTLVPCLALGAAINGVYFFLEIRRIQRNVQFLKEIDPDV